MILSEFEQNQDLMKDSSEFGVSEQGQRRLRDPHTKKWFPVQVTYFQKIYFLLSSSENLKHWWHRFLPIFDWQCSRDPTRDGWIKEFIKRK